MLEEQAIESTDLFGAFDELKPRFFVGLMFLLTVYAIRRTTQFDGFDRSVRAINSIDGCIYNYLPSTRRLLLRKTNIPTSVNLE